MKKKQFRELLKGPKHFFLMEAHNGLSAKIVQEAGFPAIWASGLSISASLGVRDNNEISYTQLIDVLEFMNDACGIPIMVDGDTGYGNFNNASILLRKLEERGIAAVCIEDKLFPKTNSFIENNSGSLADPAEFAGKIRAMKAAQSSEDFTVVARLESLIVGAGVEDAVKRAEIYLEAGADALLVHSKRFDAKEIDAFLSCFKGDAPIFLVPTKYYSVPVSHLTRDKRVRGIIWANHNIRASAKSMQIISRRIFEEKSIAGAEDDIVSVSEIFRLQNQDEYLEMEKVYLPGDASISAVILAAGSPGSLDIQMPKSLIVVNGKKILEHQIAALKSVGITKMTIVRGYKKELIHMPEYKHIDNDLWQDTGVMYSLSLASKIENEPYVVLYSDIFFKRWILHHLIDFSLETNADIILICVREDYIYNGFSLHTDRAEDPFEAGGDIWITEVVPAGADKTFVQGEAVYFSGLMMVKNPRAVKDILNCENITKMTSKIFFERSLESKLKIATVITATDAVIDINTVSDIMKAGEIV